MSALGGPASAAAVLLRIARSRRKPAEGERCEMCSAPIGDEHAHVVNLESRGLMCTCRPCYLLFTHEESHLRYRAVPERYLSFGGAGIDARAWDELGIPVGLAFLFRNSALGRTLAFYPGPAGATESQLPLDAWDSVARNHPELAVLRPDVEALLVRRTEPATATCYLVPVDAAYELVGRLRAVWRGFDGGSEAHAAIDAFFAQVAGRARPWAESGAS